MKRVKIFSLKKIDKSIIKLIKENGLKFVNRNPDLIISIGGDGSFFISERKFPRIPKLLVRNSNICFHCNNRDFSKVIKDIAKNKYKVKKLIKLKTDKDNLIAVNDVVIRNKDQREALRFDVFINNKPKFRNIIGDGVIISTPFGSHGYFHSITNKNFNRGIGIALNNTTMRFKPLIVNENSKIKIKINRSNAIVTADNDNKFLKLKPNQTITISKHKDHTHIIK